MLSWLYNSIISYSNNILKFTAETEVENNTNTMPEIQTNNTKTVCDENCNRNSNIKALIQKKNREDFSKKADDKGKCFFPLQSINNFTFILRNTWI